MTESHERLEDLLVAQATEGLDAAQARELDRLLTEHPDTDADDATPELRLLRVLEPAWLGSDAAPAGSPTDRGSGSP